MPRRSYKKSSRPGYLSCGKMVLSDASKALAIARNVASLINVEIKNHDNQQTEVALAATPAIIQLSNIPQGDTTISRDGAQCKILYINLQYTLTVNATDPRTSVRILLVCDKQTNQAIYLHTDLLDDVTTNDNIVSPFNLNNKQRFVVMYDRWHGLSLQNPTIKVKRNIRVNKHLRFDASTSAIADLTMNSFSLVQMTNEAVNVPTITSFIRLRFVDN